eukprot:TRINITY_DN67869_c6_g3_i1.p1 TRINITY_DN67869_c6_g3~~TRINITY_DN67869_c6_g3_i1.p1  ORF type:complete len:521 (-),score=60.26 TRINITY_DN67869_c6_g3_i1:96-1535(-)
MLNITESTPQNEVKRAFKKAAMYWHPDKHRGKDKEVAQEMMKNINAAYDVLGDADKRAAYDKLRLRVMTHGQWKDTFSEYTGTSATLEFADSVFLCPAWMEYYYGFIPALLVCGGGWSVPVLMSVAVWLAYRAMRWGAVQPRGFKGVMWKWIMLALLCILALLGLVSMVLTVAYLELFLVGGMMIGVPLALMYIAFVYVTPTKMQLRVLKPFFGFFKAISNFYNKLDTKPAGTRSVKGRGGKMYEVDMSAAEVKAEKTRQAQLERNRQAQLEAERIQAEKRKKEEEELQRTIKTVKCEVKKIEKPKKEWKDMDDDERVETLRKELEVSGKKGPKAAKETLDILRQLEEGWSHTKGGKRTLANSGAMRTLGEVIQRNCLQARIVATSISILNSIADIQATHMQMEEEEVLDAIKLGVGASTDPSTIITAVQFMLKLPPRMRTAMKEVRKAALKVPQDHGDYAECQKLVAELAQAIHDFQK